MSVSEQKIEETILRLVAERGVGKTICPSEAAKALGADAGIDWHGLMQPIRRMAVRLARDGRLVIMRKGKPADPETFKGIYRLAVPDPK